MGGFKNTIVLLAVLGIVIIVASGSLSGPSKETRDVPLKATVSASTSGLSITNLDAFDWSNCDLQVNDDFEIKGINLASGKSVTIPAGQFATSKGTRFNLITTKPKEFFIYCRGTPVGTRSTMVSWK